MEIKLYFYCFKLSNSDFLVLIQSLAWKKTQSPLSHNGHSPLPETALLTLSKTFDGSPLLLNEEVHCPEPAFHAHCSLPLVRLVHSWPWKLPPALSLHTRSPLCPYPAPPPGWSSANVHVWSEPCHALSSLRAP